MGRTCLKLHPTGCAFSLFSFSSSSSFFFCNENTCKRLQPDCPPPKTKKRHIPDLIWLSPGIPRQEAQCLPRSSPTGKLQPLSWVSATKLED